MSSALFFFQLLPFGVFRIPTTKVLGSNGKSWIDAPTVLILKGASGSHSKGAKGQQVHDPCLWTTTVAAKCHLEMFVFIVLVLYKFHDLKTLGLSHLKFLGA